MFVQVLLRGCDAAASCPGQGSLGGLGYCPQQNPLWPDLNVHQHLEAYAAVRGMRKEDAAVTISRYKAKRFQLLVLPYPRGTGQGEVSLLKNLASAVKGQHLQCLFALQKWDLLLTNSFMLSSIYYV